MTLGIPYHRRLICGALAALALGIGSLTICGRLGTITLAQMPEEATPIQPQPPLTVQGTQSDTTAGVDNSSSPPPPQDAMHSQAITQAATDNPLPVLMINLTPYGFETAEVTLPQGRFILALNNLTQAEIPSLQLSRRVGDRIRVFQMRVPREQQHWTGVVEPPSGVYVLTVADRPDWVCHINITP